MTKDEAMILLRRGRHREWNDYRKKNPDWKPDFSNTDLSDIKLVIGYETQFDLTSANLCGASLSKRENLRYEYVPPNTMPNAWGAIKPNAYGFVNGEFKEVHRTSVNLARSLFDIFTVFPPHFSPVDHGAVFVSIANTESTQLSNTKIVFLSYAWANEEAVLAIDQWLRLKGLRTRIDKRDFFAGSRIRDEILRVMQECDAVVIFYSEQSKDKPWIQFEQELAGDLEMEAKKEGRPPQRIIYFVLDETPLPSITEKNRIAIMAKGKNFQVACEELYYNILQIVRSAKQIDLDKWSGFTF